MSQKIHVRGLTCPLLRATETKEEWTSIPAPQMIRGLFAVKKMFENHVKVKILVDSGAFESVAPPGLFEGVRVEASAASKAGHCYTVADGGEIPCLGEQKIPVTTWEGHRCGLTFQVADVTKALLSVPQLTRTGHEVVFHKTGGIIRHKTSGQEIRFKAEGGVYVLEVWVGPEVAKKSEMPFQRPGR